MATVTLRPVRRFTGLVIASSMAMVLAGALAIMLPHATGVAFTIVLGGLLLLGGVAHLIYALAAWGGP